MKNVMSFVLGATSHGPMIFSRLDYSPEKFYGVGAQLMFSGSYDLEEINTLKQLLLLRREYYGDGVFAIDCGANVGVHSLEFGKLMQGWGQVLSIEAQERIYYALSGNIALNNLFNVQAIHAAVSNQCGTLMMPEPDYTLPASYGSFELKRASTEYIGQTIDYNKNTAQVPLVTIDNFQLPRCDLIKLDVEGMEVEAIEGALKTIGDHRPLLCIEIHKSDREKIFHFLQGINYRVLPFGLNVLAIHAEDKCSAHIHHQPEGQLR